MHVRILNIYYAKNDLQVRETEQHLQLLENQIEIADSQKYKSEVLTCVGLLLTLQQPLFHDRLLDTV